MLLEKVKRVEDRDLGSPCGGKLALFIFARHSHVVVRDLAARTGCDLK